jgi:urea transport system ATP-binding protein
LICPGRGRGHRHLHRTRCRGSARSRAHPDRPRRGAQRRHLCRAGARPALAGRRSGGRARCRAALLRALPARGRRPARSRAGDLADLKSVLLPDRALTRYCLPLENHRTAFAAAPREQQSIPDEGFELFPVLKDTRRRGGDLSAGQQQLAIARALLDASAPAVARSADRGHSASINKQVGAVIERLAAEGAMAILLVEQYLDFARELADDLLVMDRGRVVVAGGELDEADARRYLTV